MFVTEKGLKKSKIVANLLIFSLLFIFVSISCVNKNEVSEKTKFDEFETPKSHPLKFSEEKPLKWDIIDLDTLPTPKTSYLDLDKLPSIDFELNSFKPLMKPMTTVKLD